MSGAIKSFKKDDILFVEISNAGKLNAMNRKMWRELKDVFLEVNPKNARCIIISGDEIAGNGSFSAGGDISEYAGFRFEQGSLYDFHENYVWSALSQMLTCDVPIIAKLRGNCLGAGLEIASCADIRLACDNARFGVPISKLGFPIAPREAELIAREVGITAAKQMLYQAKIFTASQMLERGFLSEIIDDKKLDSAVLGAAGQICKFSPDAAALNKQVFRDIADKKQLDVSEKAYAYAPHNWHKEGIAAFMQKRLPKF